MNNKEQQKHYVYVHRIKDTGEIFYVGKGTKHRLRSKHGRSLKWKSIASNNDWTYEIHRDNLTEDEASLLEVEMIQQLNPAANVHNTDIRTKRMHWWYFSERYYYDATSPTGLRYAEWNGQFGKKRREKGDVAGTLGGNGYYTVCFRGKNYMAHRVVWCLTHRLSLHLEIIDHIDRNRKNNKIDNLRMVSRKVNTKNTTLRKDSKTGYVGVGYLPDCEIYIATWVDDSGSTHRQYFSAKKYGHQLALAVERRQKAVNKNSEYLQNEDYVRLPPLEKYKDEEIDEMLNCPLTASNKTGVRNIHYAEVTGGSYWVYSEGGLNQRFSCCKFGKLEAFEFAVLFKNYREGLIRFDQLPREMQEHLESPTRNNNKSGFPGLTFKGVNKDIIFAQVLKRGQHFSKSFQTKELGLLPALLKARQWLLDIKNSKV